MITDSKLLVGKGEREAYLLPQMACRHGLVTGATGTGKTVTLKTLAQDLSDAGAAVMVCDVKGDVSGMAIPAADGDKPHEGLPVPEPHACPVRFWDVFGERGLPLRTTVSEMGPQLLARLLGLTEVQAGVLNIVFHVADDQGLLLLDLKDLRAMLAWVADHAADLTVRYGSVAKQSVGAIQRALLELEDAGGEFFFGEPALELADWMETDGDGHGVVNVLDCVKLVSSPLVYSSFLIWMLSELYENLPEVGDVDVPKMCLFFDEAHLLFKDTPAAMVDKIEQVVRLIRSKGVSVWFVTQSPADIPGTVLAQLNNRVQHGLRAYTPAEQRALKAAAESFRAPEGMDVAATIGELGRGEALVSFLDESGAPTPVERVWVMAPGCAMGAASEDDRRYLIDNCPLTSKYATTLDRESAYEVLEGKAVAEAQAAEEARAAEQAAKEQEAAAKAAAKEAEKAAAAEARAAAAAARAQERAEQKAAAAREREEAKAAKRVQRYTDAMITSAARSVGTQIARGILGSLLK